MGTGAGQGGEVGEARRKVKGQVCQGLMANCKGSTIKIDGRVKATDVFWS